MSALFSGLIGLTSLGIKRTICMSLLLMIPVLIPPGQPALSVLSSVAAADDIRDEIFSSGEIRLARHPAPSPDGSVIAFSYQGDIWTVPKEGGEAKRLTIHPAYDAHPIWSPDGKWIAFSTERDGNQDLYALPVEGGRIRRLTYFTGTEYINGWTPDSKAVLFSGYRQIYERGERGTFMVSLDGNEPVAIFPTGGTSAVLSPDGTRLLYQRGSVQWWRRGYEGNSRYKLWLAELPSGESIHARSSSQSTAPRLSDRSDLNQIDSADQAKWDGPMSTNAGMMAQTSLYPECRHFNLTELGSESDILWGDFPNGYLDTYLTGPPAWSHPEREAGSNRDPQWFPDGDHLMYLSEWHGVSNLKVMSISGGSRAWITRFEDGRLRLPRLSSDGSLAAFEYEDGIYTVEIPDELPEAGASKWDRRPPEAKRLRIVIPIDTRIADVERINVNRGASEVAVSPDGEQIAFVCNQELFAMKASEDESTAYRLTDTAARDYDICWAPDSKSLIFVSDRGGNEDIYSVKSTSEDEERLARSLHREITQITDDDRDESQPQFSPDGELIAFVRNQGTLLTMKPDGSDQKILVDGRSYIRFAWSPDNKWIVFEREDSNFNSDVWIISVDGQVGPHNISQHPDYDGSPFWSRDGKIIAFTSTRTFLNQSDIWYVRLSLEDEQRAEEDRLAEFSESRSPGWSTIDSGSNQDDDEEEGDENGEESSDADDDEEEEEALVVTIDFDDIHKRLHRLTTLTGDETSVYVANDGDGFVFRASADGETDLWYVEWDGSEPKRITKGGTNPLSVQLNEEGNKLFYIKSGGTIASVPFSGGESKSYSYSSKMTLNRAEQRMFVFDEAWRMMSKNFYDPEFHGVDWPAMRKKYKKWARAASTYADFQDVVKMMIGELNSSHQGYWGGPTDWSSDQPKARSGQLGVFFDAHYTGPGMKIAHVVKKSAADRISSRLEVGEVVHAISGVPISPQVCIAQILEQTPGDKVILDVANEEGQRREVIIRPNSTTTMRELIYEEELGARRRFVAERGKGEVAYIHIDGMDEESLDIFERDLYAEANGKEALIIDVRGNGGGWTTDLMLTSLLAGNHAVTIPRDGEPGYPEGRRLFYAWTKPVVVLCDEHSFSNAEIFSWSIKALDRGLVVGQRTYGGVISTGGRRLADGSWVRKPFRKWITLHNQFNEEGTGCPPDISVRKLPGELARGVDQQLDRALREALDLID